MKSRKRKIWGKKNLSRFVSSESTLSSLFPFSTSFKLSQIPVIIPLHLQIKHLRITRRSRWNQPGVEQLQDPVTDRRQFGLNLSSIVTDHRHMVFVTTTLLFLLDRGNNPPRSTSSSDHVFVSHREEVSLFYGEFLVVDGGGDFLHVLHHFFIPFGLLGEFRHVDIFLASRWCGCHCFGFFRKWEDWGGEERERERGLVFRKAEKGKGGVSLCYVIWEGKGGAIFGVVRAVALIALVKMDGGFWGMGCGPLDH